MELYDNARFVIAVSSALSSIGVCTSIADLNSVVTELIAKGAIIPVQCKDCKHFIQEEHGCNHFGYYSHTPWVDEVDFCSYGERREEE
jgi:hypothetical protein